MRQQFEELLKKLQESDIKQTEWAYEWIYNLPEDIQELFKQGNYKVVETEIDVCVHRWYETSITVVEVLGSLLGIRLVSKSYSETQELEDIYHFLKFYEMKEYTTISYTIKS